MLYVYYKDENTANVPIEKYEKHPKTLSYFFLLDVYFHAAHAVADLARKDSNKDFA